VAHVSAAPSTTRAVTAPGPAGRPVAALGRPAVTLPARRLAARRADQWLARAVWTVERTGRLGLAGLGLLVAAAVFLVSTHLRVSGEVEALRDELATAQRQAHAAATERATARPSALRALPARGEMRGILR
jgi:hypothetical protein